MILPIRGFKGNRVLYGDSLDAVGEVTEEEDDDDDEAGAEPLYAEPQFLAPCAGSPVSSETSSGDLSHQVELETKVHEDFTITEKAPTRTFSWLKAASTVFSVITNLLVDLRLKL